MIYTLRNKNRTQYLSKQGFYKKLNEVLTQEVCLTLNDFKRAILITNEILVSGTELRVKQFKFRIEQNKKPSNFEGFLKGFAMNTSQSKRFN